MLDQQILKDFSRAELQLDGEQITTRQYLQAWQNLQRRLEIAREELADLSSAKVDQAADALRSDPPAPMPSLLDVEALTMKIAVIEREIPLAEGRLARQRKDEQKARLVRDQLAVRLLKEVDNEAQAELGAAFDLVGAAVAKAVAAWDLMSSHGGGDPISLQNAGRPLAKEFGPAGRLAAALASLPQNTPLIAAWVRSPMNVQFNPKRLLGVPEARARIQDLLPGVGE